MASSVVLRLRILRNLQAWLEGTDAAAFGILDDSDNALTDFTDRAFRGRMTYGDKDPLPMLSILEVPIPLDQIVPPPDSSYSSGSWELLIQGFAVDDPNYPTDPSHVMMAAVKKRLAQAKVQTKNYRESGVGEFQILGMGPHITGMQIGAGVVRPPDEVSVKAYFWLNLTLDVVEDLLDPFED